MKSIVRGLLVCFCVLSAGLAHSHEVRPSIGDLTVIDGQMSLELRLNAEALVAGVNLDGLDDTNDSDKSDQVDQLRLLSPSELEQAFQDQLGTILGKISVLSDDTPVALSAVSVNVEELDDIEIPRETTLMIEGAVSEQAKALDVIWPAEYGTLILRQQGVQEPYTGYLSGGTPSGPIAIAGGGQKSGVGTFFQYIPVGFTHILPMGLDHILFVLGLFFLSTRFGPLLWQISAFTLAHTVTLALGAMGWVSVPAAIVEPLIAASIVFVAVENILSRGMSPWRPLVVFIFGLLHGLGFASVLGEFGLPAGAFIPALIGFNVGVEIGQLVVIAAIFILVFIALRVDRGEVREEPAYFGYLGLSVVMLAIAFLAWQSGVQGPYEADITVFGMAFAVLLALCALSVMRVDELDSYRRYVAVPASVLIGLVGAYWFVERVFL